MVRVQDLNLQFAASVIAQEAGVDDFIAEATPEDKIDVIKR